MSEDKALRLAGVVRESIVDGPGIRMTVFVQGCPHHCEGCHNPQTHDFNGGYEGNIEKILAAFDENPLLRGMTFSGGEPVMQAEALLPLAKAVIARGKNLVLFTGFTMEELFEMSKTRPAVGELVSLCDLVIDGPFVLDEKDLTLIFRGSRNQRLLNGKECMRTQSIVFAEQK